MKILHVIPSIAPVRGGPSIAVIAMVKSLRIVGIDAEIATTNDNGNTLLDIPLNDLHDYQSVPVRFFARFSPNLHAMREFAFSASFTTWLWQHIRDYDLIHVHAIFSYPSTIAMAIARSQNVPYIIRPLGQLCEWSLQQSKRKKEVYLTLIEKANLKGATALHLTSKQEQKELESLNWNLPNFILPHGLVLPTPIPAARQQLHQILNILLEIPIILFLSRLHPKKGIDYLIPALAKLQKQNFAFVLAGNGDSEYEAELDRLIKENNLSDRTYKLGFVSGEKKNICLQGADLYVLTSHSENFGVAVLEALASGTPAIVTKGVALSELIKEQNLGWVVDLEINAIAEAIQQFLDNQKVGKIIGDRATQYVQENYTWEKIAAQMALIYSKITNH
ncbi:glycosyltransferase [Pseudanabaena mucicola]|uniref:Glycosyltransferase n=1 Tax=Pseudanabaena mucicola FACHB-723 TaxID=2692860 RepID=A0ABR7ZUJ6_9CYAN|nr:glycosyltransferase [Pseudanabaena mucicola]MBD2187078.1 glycosyltransferase [Pseudanabaena mucicola FACHB-723]